MPLIIVLMHRFRVGFGAKSSVSFDEIFLPLLIVCILCNRLVDLFSEMEEVQLKELFLEVARQIPEAREMAIE